LTSPHCCAPSRASAESGDGARFAAISPRTRSITITIYGPHHRGRAEIAHMLQDMFHRDAAGLSLGDVRSGLHGAMGYAWSLSSFTLVDPAVQGPARGDRRHEPFHRARTA